MADTVRVLVVDEDPNVFDLTAESLETEAPELEVATAVHERDPDLPCVLYTAHDRETVVAEYDTTLSGFVRKRTGTDQYAELASVVRGLAD